MKGLAGKHFLVTGGASGIGAGTVRRLLEEGANVTAADVNATGLERKAEELGNPAALHNCAFDLASEASIVALVKDAVGKFGRLDGAVNVAADVSVDTLGRDVAVDQFDPALWTHVLNVNLIGSGILTRECLPHIVAAGGGAMVLISSAAAWMADNSRPAYAMSKIGLHALARHTARAWGKKGVRCNVVAPGLVLTEASAQVMSQADKDTMMAMICGDRLGTPDDLGAAITFLLSDDGGWINGQIWSVDGGFMLRDACKSRRNPTS